MTRNEDREPPVLEDRERRNLRGLASILFCDTIGEHRTLQGGTTATSTNVVVRRGYATLADGGGGVFVWTTDTSTPQSVDPRGGTLVVPRGLPRTGCWKRIYSGPLNVRWFGAVGNGAVDDSAAIQAAIDASLPTGQVYFPTGSYLVTNTLRITQDRTHLFGDGLYATQIFFSPASTPELLKLEKQGGELFQCTVREMSFLGQGATQKIAISATDTSDLLIERVSTLFWTGGGSIGLQLRGREATTVRKVSLTADRPITIEPNPNATIDADHYHFEDLFLSIPVIDSPEACVTIEGATAESPTGVNVSNLIFDGTNSFNGGKYGIYRRDTVALQPQHLSIYLGLRSIRHEQASIGR